jgi:head-tail adaptor
MIQACMRSTQAGSKRQRLALYDVPESTVDPWGQPSQTPVLIGTYWAEVRMLRGDEMLNVRQMWPTATHIIKMRWLGSSIPASSDNPASLILPDMKLMLTKNGILVRVFNIVAAQNTEERNREWKITAEEKVGAIS